LLSFTAHAAQDAQLPVSELPSVVRTSVVKAFPQGAITEAGKRTKKGEIIFLQRHSESVAVRLM